MTRRQRLNRDLHQLGDEQLAAKLERPVEAVRSESLPADEQRLVQLARDERARIVSQLAGLPQPLWELRAEWASRRTMHHLLNLANEAEYTLEQTAQHWGVTRRQVELALRRHGVWWRRGTHSHKQ